MRSRLRRAAIGLLLAVLIAWAAVFFAPVVARAAPWGFEVGQEYSLAAPPAPYALVRYNWRVADISIIDSQVWILPEAGIYLTSPASAYGRVQALFDTPIATLGAEARAGDGTRGRLFVRFNL